MSATTGGTAAGFDTTSFAGFELLGFRSPRLLRSAVLLVGLYLFGVGLALTIIADLGADPWTVFHEGVAGPLGITIGGATIGTGLVIIGLLWWLKEPLGVGTIANAIVIGVAIDLTLWMVPDVSNLLVRVALLAVAPVVIGIASGLYLGSGCGPGPRDGLMTALARRGMSTSIARTCIELAALAIGWLLGGTVGLGTVWIAVSLGPCVQFFLRRVRTLSTRPDPGLWHRLA